jgi:hypothetical protein
MGLLLLAAAAGLRLAVARALQLEAAARAVQPEAASPVAERRLGAALELAPVERLRGLPARRCQLLVRALGAAARVGAEPVRPRARRR